MKKRVIVCLLASAALFSCQKNEVSIPIQEDVEVYALMEGMAKTKTILDKNNNVLWSSGDQLTIFNKNTLGLKYQVIEDYVGKNYGGFSRVLSEDNDNVYAGMALDHLIAYYPYADGISCSKADSNEPVKSYELTGISLPPEQLYVSGSFSNGAFPMVAVSEDNNIVFKNVCGGIKLQLKGLQKVTSIRIEGKNSEKLSGPATVTVYSDDIMPAIMMSSGASTSVTLNCGEGVQLNESTATEFIISLPPVLFSNGFTVTITDSADQKYVVETNKTNTVLRSTLLVMPVVRLNESGSKPEEDDDLKIPVSTVILNYTSMNLYEGDKALLTAKILPIDATNPRVIWSSDAPAIASVDQDGEITAISKGSAVITATADGVSETCSVNVSSSLVAMSDYVDEYGINHGKGIAIGMAVWAPVNCGYHKTDYPYGKLYQWGRKYGQGYDETDATYPTLEDGTIKEGGVSLAGGQSEANKEVFFLGFIDNGWDWVYPADDKLWNSGTESSPAKNVNNDPCPDGWRVPTCLELMELSKNYSDRTINESGQSGYWFSGSNTYKSSVPQIFLPAAGVRNYFNGHAGERGFVGHYWSSRKDDTNGYGASYLTLSGAYISDFFRADGYSVRCVQE